MDSTPHRDARVVTLVILLVLAAMIAAGLYFFGIGAELSRERTVVMTVRVSSLPHEVSSQIESGETVFADPGGMVIGEITDVVVEPVERTAQDARGRLHPASDPVMDQATITIEARGREGDGIVALHNQVVQGGQTFNVVTRKLFLRGTVLTVDVR
jgi:hypothetical protein